MAYEMTAMLGVLPQGGHLERIFGSWFLFVGALAVAVSLALFFFFFKELIICLQIKVIFESHVWARLKPGPGNSTAVSHTCQLKSLSHLPQISQEL